MSDQRVPTTAVLLAAGGGKRLRPLTDVTPKCLLPINGRPILEYILESLDRARITQVFVVTHHLEQQVISYLATNRPPSLRIEVCHQEHLGGTAQALCTTREAVSRILPNTSSIIVCATDYVLSSSYISDLIHFHKEHSCPITLSLRRILPSQIPHSSLVIQNDDQDVARIVEKPEIGAYR